jgi:hypothetical protein
MQLEGLLTDYNLLHTSFGRLVGAGKHNMCNFGSCGPESVVETRHLADISDKDPGKVAISGAGNPIPMTSGAYVR